MINKFIYEIECSEIQELVDSAKQGLIKNDYDYRRLNKQVEKIKEDYPKVKAFIEEEILDDLAKKECEMLNKIMTLKEQMNMLEEYNIFLKGSRQAYEYFKKIDILR